MKIDLEIYQKHYVIGKFQGVFVISSKKCIRNTQKHSRSKTTVTQCYCLLTIVIIN